jgi:hypothetical protein
MVGASGFERELFCGPGRGMFENERNDLGWRTDEILSIAKAEASPALTYGTSSITNAKTQPGNQPESPWFLVRPGARSRANVEGSGRSRPMVPSARW